jgi:hypothetical protein
VLSVPLYHLETKYVPLIEGHKLCVFENRGLKGIFGPRREGGKEGYNLYWSPKLLG